MSTTEKLQGTCSVCLRVIQIRGDRPIRHGFSAIGVQHGAHSGYHTGPCQGIDFPHLGISDEGTRWALDHARARLADNTQSLDELATYPDLIWYPHLRGSYNRKTGGTPDLSRPVTLRRGEDVPYAGDGRPDYDSEHKRRVTKLSYVKDELERTIAAYEKVIATWSPEKYPVIGAKAKEETTHMEMPRKNNRGEEWMGILCRFTRSGYASDKIKKTNDPSKVTCTRCRNKLGLPPK